MDIGGGTTEVQRDIIAMEMLGRAGKPKKVKEKSTIESGAVQ